MDGPPSYLILVNDIRGEDSTWEPPVSDLIGMGKAFEPNSVGIYMNDDGMDEKTVILTNGIALQISLELLKKPGLKILERGKLSAIIQEIKLGETGLVSEETGISSAKLMKEEFALFMKAGMDTISKESRIECEIFCKKGAKKIGIVNIDLRIVSSAIHDMSEKIYSIINKYVNQ
ncbi:MAG: hypothetical protein JXA23_10175 [Bacteroidales bacterium]|nr:hypothetical protein [Bacteroidales bacterium]